MNQSEFKANACSRRQARENACEGGTIGFVWLLIGRERGASFVNQSQSVVKQSQSKREIT